MFCSSRSIELFEVDHGAAHKVGQLPLSGVGKAKRGSLLQQERARVLICGAIQREQQQDLRQRGIHVFPWASGEVREVLALLARRKEQPDNGQAPRRSAPETALEPIYPAAVTATGDSLDAEVACNPRICRYLVLLRGGQDHEVRVCPHGQTRRDALEAVKLVAEAGARTMLTWRCGPAMIGLLAVAGIQVYLGVGGSVREVARAYSRGHLHLTL